MLNATALIRKHGHDDKVRRDAAALIERGLSGIRNVVRAALISYKGVADPELLERGHLDDLQFLVRHEVERRRLTLEWDNVLPDSVPINGQLARQAVLNLLLNACAASPLGGIVGLQARMTADGVAIAVTDRGPGLPEEVAQIYAGSGDGGPPPAGELGLGVWTVSRLMRHLAGTVVVDSSAAGTRIELRIPFVVEERLHAVA
jgi:signal transduction histidine kinase